ncbi:MAG: hypothetical protein EXR72_23320 [Myxococcales bacterium]|nr:hypothetical protein [Myxococcales bacterium]
MTRLHLRAALLLLVAVAGCERGFGVEIAIDRGCLAEPVRFDVSVELRPGGDRRATVITDGARDFHKLVVVPPDDATEIIVTVAARDALGMTASGRATIAVDGHRVAAASLTLTGCALGDGGAGDQSVEGADLPIGDLPQDPGDLAGRDAADPPDQGAPDAGSACTVSADCPAAPAPDGGLPPKIACCKKACIDVNRDPMNCTACGSACPAIPNGLPGCNGACVVASCVGAFRDCNKVQVDGCEINGASDVTSCGMCGQICPKPENAAPSCTAGKCGLGPCTAGFIQCDGDPQNGCEVHLASDPLNCGACGNKCPPNTHCKNGVCGGIMCNAPLADCDGNPQNSCEINLSTDVDHCGVCGKVCPLVANGTRGCAADLCGIATCTDSFRDCDKVLANGCEASTLSNAHCGMCNNMCLNGVACVNGSCAAQPPDMAVGDLAMSDLAMSDLAKPPDLAKSPDLAKPADLAMGGDLPFGFDFGLGSDGGAWP